MNMKERKEEVTGDMLLIEEYSYENIFILFPNCSNI